MKSIRSGNSSQKMVLALTMGDPAGVGLEIALKAWLQRDQEGLAPFVLYANASEVRARADLIGADVPVSCVTSPALAGSVFGEALPVIDIALASPVKVGEPESANGAGVVRAIDQAVADTMDGLSAGLVTNPISKATMYESGFTFPGHTEYLGHLVGGYGDGEPIRPVMMLACDELRVVPATIHIPLRDVCNEISEDLIFETGLSVFKALKCDFGIGEPRLAITGLNPHAGENNALGTEDSEIITPAILRLENEGVVVTGPHPADTLFHEAARKTYDAVVAMYHDQALIPIKTLAFDRGVNVTLGLPLVRTSPDHGTAFDIAGTGKASASSLIASLKMAIDIAGRRIGSSPERKR